jgi:LmeA-like phospholipid-binding
MADWLPFYRSWADEWRRNWSEVWSASTSSAAAAAASVGMPKPGTLPGDVFMMMVGAARSWLIGKKRTFRFRGHDLTMFLTDLSVEGSDLARAVGQYGQVAISARDIGWGGYQLERMEIQARNVHVRPGRQPVLVAAPVFCEALVPAWAASRWLATVLPRLTLTLQEGIPQIAVAGAPWARLEVEAGAQGRSIRIQPRALHLRDRRLSLRSPAFHVSLPALPGGITLTSVAAAPGGFVLRGVINEWQRPLSADDIERLLAAMRGGKDRLDI